MTTQQLLAPLRRAITDYKMIENGDKIAVGLSGGKDSLSLLKLLKAYQRFSTEKFDLIAVRVDMGFKDTDQSQVKALADFCSELNVPYKVIPTDLAEILFESRKESNPCSLCSKMRRGALNSAIIAEGYNKLALGHHADDLVETMFLSLFFEGRFNTFSPVSYMDRTGVTLIRPMVYIEEKNLSAYSKTMPVLHNPCPANHKTQREYIKGLIKQIQQQIPSAKDKIHSAITHPDRNNLWDIKKPKEALLLDKFCEYRGQRVEYEKDFRPKEISDR